MQKTYQKLLFDLDNTLVDDDENRKYAIKQILLERNEKEIEKKTEDFIKADNKFWKDRAARKIKAPYVFKNNEEKTKWVRAQRFIRFFEDITFEEAVEINNKYIKYLEDNIIPIKNSKEILEYLYDKNYEIYIITNSPKNAVKNKLVKGGLQRYIKDSFSSEEAGHMKPHGEFFELFFKKLGTYKKGDMIIIGDELDKDVLGGIENGIDSCWVNIKKIDNNTNLKPNYEIHDLIELKNIL